LNEIVSVPASCKIFWGIETSVSLRSPVFTAPLTLIAKTTNAKMLNANKPNILLFMCSHFTINMVYKYLCF
jgi:hypothetical protein